MNTISGPNFRQIYSTEKAAKKTRRSDMSNPIQKIEKVLDLSNYPQIVLSSPKEDNNYNMYVCSNAGEILQIVETPKEESNAVNEGENNMENTTNTFGDYQNFNIFRPCGGSPTSIAFVNKGDITDFYIANNSNGYISKENFDGRLNYNYAEEQMIAAEQNQQKNEEIPSQIKEEQNPLMEVPQKENPKEENPQIIEEEKENSQTVNKSKIKTEEQQNISQKEIQNQSQNQSVNRSQMKEDDAPPKIYEYLPLKGPSSLVYSKRNNALIFSDCGLNGMTSLNDSNGSVFLYEFENDLLRPLLLNCLAGPVDICYDEGNDILYVAELYKNRILRLIQNPIGIFHCSVFHQFSGRFGPNALAVDKLGNLYVSRYEFQGVKKQNQTEKISDADGVISVLSKDGMQIQELIITGMPEINGMFISKEECRSHYLYYTIKNKPMVYKIKIATETDRTNEGN